MKIGIIGSSFSGLIAGEKLAKAGHDVTIIEKNRPVGGRLATRKTAEGFFDYGLPFITAEGNDFKQFIQSLVDNKILHQWAERFPLYDGSQAHKVNPNRSKNKYFASNNGLNTIAQQLNRWVDIKPEQTAGGLTYIGADRGKKRAWMINLTNISVFECDAVILAIPAVEAYGILQTAQDETPARRIIRVIDEIQYRPRYALMASYTNNVPSWKGIQCEGEILRWIGNESSKSKHQENTNLVIQSSGSFARAHANTPEEEVKQIMLEEAAEIAQPWLASPDFTDLHFWKYYQAINPLNEFFMEMEMNEAPLVLIGDYFNGNSVEAAYLSGMHLANYWIDKYDRVAVNS